MGPTETSLPTSADGGLEAGQSSTSTPGTPVPCASSLGELNVSPEAGPLKTLMLKNVVIPTISCLQVSDFDPNCSKST